MPKSTPAQLAYDAAYRLAYREKRRAYNRAYQFAVRQDAVAAYGGQCVCCGTVSDLQFDHRELNGSGNKLIKRLRREGYPRDRIQLLCRGCNMAKYYAHRRSLQAAA